jgi:3-O-methylgallate 3,4-dioxygenase
MAKIVLGMAASHGPMLGTAPQDWENFRASDRQNPMLFFRKKLWDYDGLEQERASENLAQYMTPPEKAWRHAACMTALDKLMAVYDEVRPDVVVIIGNDHKEAFTEVTPSLGVYWSEAHENGPMHPGMGANLYAPAQPVAYPGLPDLGLHMIEQLQAENFDLASISRTPRQGGTGARVMPHAFGFVYHRLFNDKPPPSLAVHLNTFYPPNQPSLGRAFEVGDAIIRAIESWDSDKTVALFGSGGLSHFIVDEALDRELIDILSNDLEKLKQVDERLVQAGTSEIKNWIPVAMALERLGARMNLIDYVPCYRSPAGNGHGMTFAYWRP